jgi:single-stranded-DNA-specific exonuclease
MLEKLKEAIDRIDELSRDKNLKVISHFDSDGITSAAIFSRALERWRKKFSLEIVKSLDEEIIKNLSDDSVLIFLDLASNSMEYLKEKKTEVFIFDHHEIVQEIPENVFIVNPFLEECEMVSSAAICYLFAKTLNLENKDLANLAVIGMVGDMYEKNIGKIFDEILKDSESTVKKGILVYPSTRPLNLALEYSSNPFIPGITGSREGVIELLRDSGIRRKGERYKALYELDEDEMMKLVTAIMLRGRKPNDGDSIIGNLFLVKFFNKLEDARELSASINACSRMGRPEIALGFCLGNRTFRKEAEKVYIDYKQKLIAALKYVSTEDKMEGKNYMIFHGRDKVKDTIIGTVASILSHSPLYPEGQVIVALTYNEDKIKVSARVVGRKGRNVRDVLHRVVVPLGGEVGGHENAAGCLISKEQEGVFIESLKKALDIDLVKV